MILTRAEVYGGRNMIYFDHTADTPPDSRVLEEYIRAAQIFANPNSAHSAGQRAKNEIDGSISLMAKLLHIKPSEIIMTSGASEANNLAVKGLTFTDRRRGKHIVSTFLEHSSVSGALTFLQEQGWEIDIVNVKPDGMIDIDHLRTLLREDTVLCAVCAVDSELGTVQPIGQIAEILKDYPNCRFHVDATQAIGKIKLDLTQADTASFAPHKFYGLKGSGILYKREEIVLEPMIHGGASTTIYRSGTPDTAAIAAAAKALELTENEFEKRLAYVTNINRILRDEIRSIRGLIINSPENAVPHILNVSSTGIKGSKMQELLNEKGICISVKSACSVPNTPSRPVMAITHDRKRALSSWRISLSHLTTKQDMEALIKALREIMEHEVKK